MVMVNKPMTMKYLLIVSLSLGLIFNAFSAESPTKKKAPAKVTSAEKPSTKAEAISRTLTPAQKTKLLNILNSGQDEALLALPGIGETRAQAIKKARPLAEPSDLVKVDGIGEAILADIVAHAQAGFPEKAPKGESKESAKKKPTVSKKEKAS
jgi:DNA uptake protein ComE-like DNA-binding protein